MDEGNPELDRVRLHERVSREKAELVVPAAARIRDADREHIVGHSRAVQRKRIRRRRASRPDHTGSQEDDRGRQAGHAIHARVVDRAGRASTPTPCGGEKW